MRKTNGSDMVLLRNRQTRIGTKIRLTSKEFNGVFAECINYTNAKNITLKLNSGEILEHQRWDRFVKGIAYKNHSSRGSPRQRKIGKTVQQHCGLPIKYKGTKVMENGKEIGLFQFQDGTEISGRYDHFLAGKLRYPGVPQNIYGHTGYFDSCKLRYLFSCSGSAFYDVTEPSGEHNVMTLEMLMIRRKQK